MLDGGVAIPREQVEGLAAGDACKRGEVKALLNKDLQQVGVLGAEGGWWFRAREGHAENVRYEWWMSRKMFGLACIGHQAPGTSQEGGAVQSVNWMRGDDSVRHSVSELRLLVEGAADAYVSGVRR